MFASLSCTVVSCLAARLDFTSDTIIVVAPPSSLQSAQKAPPALFASFTLPKYLFAHTLCSTSASRDMMTNLVAPLPRHVRPTCLVAGSSLGQNLTRSIQKSGSICGILCCHAVCRKTQGHTFKMTV